jgi:4-amino-4-deoxy-L-arabinose transferase-like glycosyltransferase
MSHNNVLLTSSIQGLLSLFSIVLVGKIADRIFPNLRPGIIAMWLMAFEPISVTYAVCLMPETLFVFLMLITLDRVLAYEANLSRKNLILAGIALAAATYVRPVSYYLVFALAIGIACTASRVNRLLTPATLLLTTVPLLGLWQVRNFTEAGYSGFSSVVDKNLYFYQAAGVTAHLDRLSLSEVQDSLGYPDQASYLKAHPEQRLWSQAAQLRFMREQALAVLAAHPVQALRSQLAGVAVVAFTPCASEVLKLLGLYPLPTTMPKRILSEGVIQSSTNVAETYPPIAAFMALLTLALLGMYLLSLLGVVEGLLEGNSSRLATLTLIGFAVYFLLISGGAQAVGRYRLPVMPELCILAAAGLCRILKQRRSALSRLRL